MSRAAPKNRSRKENTREERKTTVHRKLLTFSFRYFTQEQPDDIPETVQLWIDSKLIIPLINRFKELSNLTRDEAINQKQIKAYKTFPPLNKTKFKHPSHIDSHVNWAVIKNIGGEPRVAGFIEENTFYVVFLDSKHQFWHSEKKHT